MAQVVLLEDGTIGVTDTNPPYSVEFPPLVLTASGSHMVVPIRVLNAKESQELLCTDRADDMCDRYSDMLEEDDDFEEDCV